MSKNSRCTYLQVYILMWFMCPRAIHFVVKLWTFFWCRIMLLLSLKLLSQFPKPLIKGSPQSNGFSSSWSSIRCFVSWTSFENFALHSIQVFGFFPSWTVFICLFKVQLRTNFLPQSWQVGLLAGISTLVRYRYVVDYHHVWFWFHIFEQIMF